MSNPKVTQQPRNAMGAAWNKAVQKHATSKKPAPPKPTPKPKGLGEFEGGLLPDAFGPHWDLL